MLAPSAKVKRRTARVDGNAALGAAEWNVDQRALKRHPCGERSDLVAVDGGGEANTALVGPQGVVVLDAVALKDLESTVVHRDREVHDDLVARFGEYASVGLAQVDEVRGSLKLLDCRFMKRTMLAHGQEHYTKLVRCGAADWCHRMHCGTGA